MNSSEKSFVGILKKTEKTPVISGNGWLVYIAGKPINYLIYSTRCFDAIKNT